MHIQTSHQESLNLGIGNYTCNWGVHIAGLYENEQERDEILFGFLHQGILAGNLQMYCPEEQTKDEFSSKYSRCCPQHAHQLENQDRFRFYSAKELYYPNGKFSPKEMDENLGAFYKKSQQDGKRNIRATAEMIWALESIPGIEHLMVYESRLNYFIKDKTWISICMYNIKKFTGDVIMNVLRTHPYTINKGIITQNPYFVNPDKWIADNAPQFLNN